VAHPPTYDHRGGLLADGRTLEKYLKSCFGNIIDLDFIVIEKGKKCRLVAMRSAPEIIAALRAERRKKEREGGKQPCPKGRLRDGWHLMLANLSKEQADVSQFTSIYRARWVVEIQFRVWKQAFNLGKAPIANATNIICKHWCWQE
jgi:IS4 transposase